jgi:hypothetical protein
VQNAEWGRYLQTVTKTYTGAIAGLAQDNAALRARVRAELPGVSAEAVITAGLGVVRPMRQGRLSMGQLPIRGAANATALGDPAVGVRRDTHEWSSYMQSVVETFSASMASLSSENAMLTNRLRQ